MSDYDLIMKERNWLSETELGRAFARFENKTAEAWAKDTEGRLSDKLLREIWESQKEARKNLLILIRGW